MGKQKQSDADKIAAIEALPEHVRPLAPQAKEPKVTVEKSITEDGKEVLGLQVETLEREELEESDGPERIVDQPDDTPASVYYTDLDTKPLEGYLEYLLGAESTKHIHEMARGCNVPPIALLRQRLFQSLVIQAYDSQGAQGKRTGNDSNPNHPDNVRIRQVVGNDCYELIVQEAAEHALSNAAAFKQGVKTAIERGMI